MNRRAIIWSTHCQRERLTLHDPAYKKWVFQCTISEMMKDAGSGDITTQKCFPSAQPAKANVMAKESGIFAGEQEIRFFLKNFEGIDFRFQKHDGQKIRKGNVLLSLRGDIRHLMVVERIILNVFGRMSGIATLTANVLKKVRRKNKNILITPTRKTLWGWLDKRACVLGGGGTHRLSLENAILIKHNHLQASVLSIEKFLRLTVKRLSPDDLEDIRFFEVEVNNIRDALLAAEVFSEFKAQGFPMHFFIMFDNMTPKVISRAVQAVKRNKIYDTVLLEASGGINENNIASYAKTGVDVISLGALTHSAPMLDVSMRIV